MQGITGLGNAQPPVPVDLLFSRLRTSFFQFLHVYARPRVRLLIEYLLLFAACYALFSLLVLHVSFVDDNQCAHGPDSLFGDLPASPSHPDFPSVLYLRVQRTELLFADPRPHSQQRTPPGPLSFFQPQASSSSSSKSGSVLGTSLAQLLFGDLDSFLSAPDSVAVANDPETTLASPHTGDAVADTSAIDTALSAGLPTPSTPRKNAEVITYIFEEYEFAFERGFLLIGSESRRLHNISRANITITNQLACLAGAEEEWVPWMFDNMLGYDTFIINALIHRFNGRGYVHALHTGEIYDLWYVTEIQAISSDPLEWILFEISIVLTGIFIWFVCTMLVSLTFRETQARLLMFTVSTQHHVRQGLPIRGLLLAHLSQSFLFVLITIGVLLCISEFLDDRLLGLLLLSLVWLTEPFSLIVLHTPSSQAAFPRIFFVYLLIYLIYFFSFPFGYSYFALFVLSLFVFHIMVHFLNVNLTAAFHPFPQQQPLVPPQPNLPFDFINPNLNDHNYLDPNPNS
ncbi:MAG: hypothetical protein Q8P67_10690 [archaeon]|nr:hypothetical protein [archaeon]